MAGVPETQSNFKGTPVIMKRGKKFVTLNNVQAFLKETKSTAEGCSKF